MMKIPLKIVAALGACALLSACASSTDDLLVGEDEGLICTTETGTGSRLPKRVCTTAAERAEREEIVERQRHKARNAAQRPPPPAAPPPG